MGFFSKIWRGVKKVVKGVGKAVTKVGKGIAKIGKKVFGGIKKAFTKVAGFMGKLGPFGTIALSFLLPGIGPVLGGWASTMMGSANALVAGAGHVLNAGINIATKVGNVVSSVSKGVTNVVGKVVGATLNKIPGASDFIQKATAKLGINKGTGIDISGMTFEGVAETARTAFDDVIASGQDLFSKGTLTDLNKYSQEISDKVVKTTGDLTESVGESVENKTKEFSTKLDSKMNADLESKFETTMEDITQTREQYLDAANAQMNVDLAQPTTKIESGVMSVDGDFMKRTILEAEQGVKKLGDPFEYPSFDSTGKEALSIKTIDPESILTRTVEQDAANPDYFKRPVIDKAIEESRGSITDNLTYIEQGQNLLNEQLEAQRLAAEQARKQAIEQSLLENPMAEQFKADAANPDYFKRPEIDKVIEESREPNLLSKSNVSKVRKAISSLRKAEGTIDENYMGSAADYDIPSQYGGGAPELQYATLANHNATIVNGLGYDAFYKGPQASYTQNLANSLSYAS
jgi:F0F1-type ATP synthase membrane subunit b/b'